MINDTVLKKIAVIDDDESALFLCKKILIQYGHFVETYSSFYEFETKYSASTYSKCFDLIISDVRMPEISGLEVVKKIKAKDAKARVLLMTSFAGNDEALTALELGAVDYIAKPFDNLPLFNMIVHKWLHFDKEEIEIPAESKTCKFKKDFFLTESVSLQEVLSIIDRVASTNASILLQGETGVGKEVFAKLVHEKSGRAGKFIAVNSTAIPADLLESELFGHEKGSFTGAHEKKIGLIEQAEGGTLFLDEIGDLDLKLQAKILRFLQERRIRRVGGREEIFVDVRILSATHCALQEMIKKGVFREDLLYRLNTINVRIPSLRNRKEELIPMVNFLLEKVIAKYKLKSLGLSSKAEAEILDYSWPGNVRELQNVIERSALMVDGEEIHDLLFDKPIHKKTESLESSVAERSIFSNDNYIEIPHGLSLKEVEMIYLKKSLERNQFNKNKTARDLSIGLRTLYRKLDTKEAIEEVRH